MKIATHRKSLFVILLLLVAVALAACGGSSAPATSTAPTDTAVASAQPAALNLPVNIDPAKANEIRSRDDVVILDVREDFEYAEGHVPGALWIPLGELPTRLNEIPKDKTVIAFCRSGNRSGQATTFLRDNGFTNVHNMTGGMNEWQKAGYAVEK